MLTRGKDRGSLPLALLLIVVVLGLGGVLATVVSAGQTTSRRAVRAGRGAERDPDPGLAGVRHTRLMGDVVNSGVRIASETAGAVVQQTVAAMLTPHLGLDGGMWAGAFAGALTKEIPGIVRQIMADRLRRGTAVVEQAGAYAGMSADDFLDLLGRDEHRRTLLYRTVQAAADADTEHQIRTLAGALASGAIAEDGAAVDEALLVVAAVAGLSTLDLRVLHLLNGIPSEEDWEEELRWTTGQVRTSSGHESWPERTIGDRLRVSLPMLRHIAARLESAGMVTVTTHSYSGGDSTYSVALTPFAHRCLDHLLTTAAAPRR